MRSLALFYADLRFVEEPATDLQWKVLNKQWTKLFANNKLLLLGVDISKMGVSGTKRYDFLCVQTALNVTSSPK